MSTFFIDLENLNTLTNATTRAVARHPFGDTISGSYEIVALQLHRPLNAMPFPH
jgi:hypothetical protein